MKILQIIPTLSSGGAERFAVDLSNQLSLRNEVRLLLFYPPSVLGNQLFLKNVNKQVKLDYAPKKKGLDLNLFGKVRQYIRQFNPDIVHTHIGAFNYVAPVLAMSGRHGVHTVQNDAFKEAYDKKGLLFRKLMYRSSRIFPVTISEANAISFEKAYPQVRHKTIYNSSVYNGMSDAYGQVKSEIETYKSNADTKVFIFVGRLSAQKNPLMLTEAFKRLRASGANAILLMIGRVDEVSGGRQIFQEVAALKRDSGIFYLGEKGTVSDYLHAADFFCLSSIFEGLPLSLTEAFAAGCVPVCTPAGGIPGMVGESGFLSADMSEDAYFKALSDAMNCDPERYLFMKGNIRKLFFEKYEISQCAEKYEQLYQQLLAR